MANLKEKYNSELRPALKEDLGIDNIMAVPRLTKVVINMGCLLYTSPSPRD